MSKLIRKISIGKDYKNDAMHYAVGQEVYGGHTICDIIEEDQKFSIASEYAEVFGRITDLDLNKDDFEKIENSKLKIIPILLIFLL